MRKSAPLYAPIGGLVSVPAPYGALLLMAGTPNGYAQVPPQAIEQMNRSGGARWHFTEGLGLGTLIGGTYGHAEIMFTANSPLGDHIKTSPATAGQVVDWNVHAWTFQPSADLRYGLVFQSARPGSS